jgi:hypothetical protein
MDAAGGGRLRPHCTHALAHVVHCARVGEEHVLDAASDGAHREIGTGLLLDLHHRRHVRERLHRPREVLEGEEIVGRVLAHELHVVEHAGVSGQLGHRRPDRVDMSAEGGLTGAKPLAESVGTHGFLSG